MAITTLDGVIAGMKAPVDFLKIGITMEAAAVLYSTFYAPGLPGAAVASSAGVAGEALTSYLGQLSFSNPVSGNSYLARLACSTTITGSIILADRLWHNSGIVVSTVTEQTINSVAFPARDRAGSVNGDGVQIAIEVTQPTTNAGAITTISMRYLNQAGVEHVATIPTFPATATLGTLVPFTLAAGDTGVSQVLAITLGTSMVAGTISLVAFRQLARLEQLLINTGNSIDALTGGFVRLYDNTVPFLIFLPTATTATTISGQFIVTQG